MLSDAKLEYVTTTLNNWSALGAPSVARAGEQLGELLAEMREALKVGVSDSAEVSALIGAKVPDDMRQGVGNIRKQNGLSSNEVKKLREQLEDAHVDVLEQMVNKHEIALPKLSGSWTDDDFIAWLSFIPVMPEEMLGLMKDVKKWWNEVGNFLT